PSFSLSLSLSLSLSICAFASFPRLSWDLQESDTESVASSEPPALTRSTSQDSEASTVVGHGQHRELLPSSLSCSLSFSFSLFPFLSPSPLTLFLFPSSLNLCLCVRVCVCVCVCVCVYTCVR